MSTSVLQELLQNTNPLLCCLCLNIITEEEPFQLKDEVYLTPEDCSEDYSVMMSDMISYVLHREDFVSTSLCKSCVISTVYAYKFIEMCTTTAQRLTEFVDGLTSCLEQEDIKKTNKSRRVFIATDVNSMQSTLHYDKKKELPRYKYYTKFQCTLLRFREICYPETFQKFICDACGKECKSKTNLSKHIKNKCNKKECNTCGMLIDSRFIKRHDRVCKKGTVEDTTMIETNSNHSSRPKSHLCNICAKTVRNIKLHMLTHDPNHKARYLCKKCGKGYRWLHSYIKHKDESCNKTRKNDLSVPKAHKCNLCKCQYSNIVQLKYHMKIHSDNKDDYFECNWCQKRFPSKVALDSHVVKHTKQKNWSCHICDGQFVTKASLTYHIRTHTGEKPYKCELCDSYFTNASRRREHMKVQHLPPIECPYCSKMISQRSFPKHKRRHLNPKSGLYIGREEDGNRLSNSNHVRIHQKKSKIAASSANKKCPISFKDSESDSESEY